MIHPILTSALLLASSGPAQEDAAPLFPAASGPLRIEVSADAPGMSFMELLRTYGELTGQHLTFSQETGNLLTQYSVNLDRTVDVPAAEVQSFVEHLLVRNDFVLNILKPSAVRLLEVSSMTTSARNNLRAPAMTIPSERLDEARAHPAVLFATTINLPNTDVRQVANSMRTMITDANTQQMLPAGNSNSMVIVGFGAQLAGLADMLYEVDRAAAPAKSESDTVFEVVVLEKAVATELAAALSILVRDASQTAPGQPGPVPSKPMPKIVNDQRTNSLLISGTREQVAQIKTLIALLDV